MATLKGLDKVKIALEKIAKKKGEKSPSVTVGFTQSYGLPVHENLEAYHPVGQAKFLEQPARQNQKEIAAVVTDTVKQGGTLEQGLLKGGLLLQRMAQELTPVDTGALRASAFTAKTNEADAVAADAYGKSQTLKAKVTAKRGG